MNRLHVGLPKKIELPKRDYLFIDDEATTISRSTVFDPVKHRFNPKSMIVARINRAELGDFDALVLGLFLMSHFKGQLVVPDLGFYGRDAHVSLVRQNRLIAGVSFSMSCRRSCGRQYF